ncbi:MAG TPA: HAMP domain-containing sensor histidine kinase [Anaerolineae bacterium]
MNGFDYLLVALLLLALAGLGVSLARQRQTARAAAEAARERVTMAASGRQLEADVVLARSRLDALGEAALDGLLLLDDNRRILWANTVAWEVLRADQSAVGRSFIAVAHDLELNQAVVDALSGRRPIVRQTAVDGRTLRIRAVPLLTTGGAAVAVEDVTELQRLGRARRDLVANISHELRNPLASIDLAAQTLGSGAAEDPSLRSRMLDQIAGSVQTLSQLSQEMMDLAQIESGQVLLKLVPVEAASLVARALQSLRPQAEMKRQTLTVDIAPDLLLLADEQQAARAIGNLVHNAIKFTPEDGAIQVVVQSAGVDDAQVCVIDSGPGVPVIEQERIFERFYKADRARSRGGTGLGLAIARHIVEGHGGRIWVESAPPKGARFCFTLPLA